tara:strand:- start:316 stop:1395 length:1080 start_codon:yes stop_codon:yes gene_type:complete
MILSGSALCYSTARAADELTPLVIDRDYVYRTNGDMMSNYDGSSNEKKIRQLEKENKNLLKILETIKQDLDEKDYKGSGNNDELVTLKSNLYDLQNDKEQLTSALEVASQKIEVLEKVLEKHELNNKYLTDKLQNIDDHMDEKAVKDIQKLKGQNNSLRETIKALNETLKNKEEELAQIHNQNLNNPNQAEEMQALAVKNAEYEQTIAGLQETNESLNASLKDKDQNIAALQEQVEAMTKDKDLLNEKIAKLEAEELKEKQVIASKAPNKEVYFKQEKVPTVDDKKQKKSKSKKNKELEQLSSLDLLSIEAGESKIKYVRGEKEMISGTSDESHMEDTTVVETEYPPLEKTLPRANLNN